MGRCGPSRLAANDVDIACFSRERVARVHQLQNLALGDGVGGIRENPHDAHAIERDHHLKGARV